jgi:hypothetical protein
LCFLDNHYDLFAGIDKPQVCRNYKHEISFTHALRLREQPGETRLGHMMGDWTFFSNYGHVLVCLARNREARLRDVAADVGITERAVQKIVRDLQDGGYLAVSKQGRCNRYRINRRKSLRHDLESHCTVGKWLALVTRDSPPEETGIAVDQPAPKATKAVSPEQPAVPSKPPEQGATEPPPSQQARAKDEKPAKQAAPADTRQQGSLF